MWLSTQPRRALLEAVLVVEPAVHAFFACLYYAALRPAEARNLRSADLMRVYASCLDGQAGAAMERIEAALGGAEHKGRPEPGHV